MYYIDAAVISNNNITDDIYELIISSNEIALKAEAGQFLHIKVSNTDVGMLRRPISINRVDKDNGIVKLLYQVKGAGTKLLSLQTSQNKISVIGPIGHGFPIRKGASCAVVGGGIGIAPLLELAANLDKCDAYLGFKSDIYKIEEFYKVCRDVYISTEDGSIGEEGYITDLLSGNLKEYDIIYTCGPKIMMNKVKKLCQQNSIECYVSLEERMGCGVGACLVCACKTSDDNKPIDITDKAWSYKKVCVDGPVFRAEEVEFDE